jgi:hypothetical protein
MAVRIQAILISCLLLVLLAACVGASQPTADVTNPSLPVIPEKTFTPMAAVTEIAQLRASQAPVTETQVGPAGTAEQVGPETTQAGPGALKTVNPQIAPALDPADWKNWPVLPAISPRALEILRDGIARGNNPQVFSKIGDCESQTDWFLDAFDLGEQYYALGSYQAELAPVIAYYAGSFHRNSLAARQGFTSASLMAPIWADKQVCEKDEGPLACEYRLNHPAVAFIMLGTNDATNPKTFEKHMRDIIEYTIEQGVLPILGTKADNVEGDHSINATMARLAAEYQIPLWNYWRAVQNLPGHGLQEDGSHLTYGPPRFDDPAAMQKAWTVRNLNALQVLRIMLNATNP